MQGSVPTTSGWVVAVWFVLQCAAGAAGAPDDRELRVWSFDPVGEQGEHEYHPLWGSAIDVDGYTAVVGGFPMGGFGVANVYTRSLEGWVEAAQLEALDPWAEDSYGTRVAVDGDTIVVSTLLDLYVYRETLAGAWELEQKITLQELGIPEQLYPGTVDVSGDRLVVGSSEYSIDGERFDGAAVVLQREGSSWKLDAVLRPDGHIFDWTLGCAVAIDGDDLLVGSKNSGGSLHAFRYTRGQWSYTGNISGLGDISPQRVDLSDDVAVVGAQGKATVLIRADNGWMQASILTGESGRFGASAATDGRAIVVADLGTDSIPASVSSYELRHDEVVPINRMTDPFGDDSTYFGAAVGIDHGSLAVGATHGAIGVGRVHFFMKDSDSDGLADTEEVHVYETSPHDNETDKDGLADGEEVFIYGTDPAAWDTDGDCFSDGKEIRAGSDPLDPRSIPTPWGVRRVPSGPAPCSIP